MVESSSIDIKNKENKREITRPAKPSIVFLELGLSELLPMIKIYVNTDIPVIGFYGYIENIGEISIKRKLYKIHGNFSKNKNKNKNKKNTYIRVI